MGLLARSPWMMERQQQAAPEPQIMGPLAQPSQPQTSWWRGFREGDYNAQTGQGMTGADRLSLFGSALTDLSRGTNTFSQDRQAIQANNFAQAQGNWNRQLQGRQQGDWARQDKQIADWTAAVQGEQDPQRRAQLQAIGPQGYGEFISNQERMAFQAAEGQKDRDTQIRAAQMRAANENSLGRYFQQMDAQTIGTLNEQAAQIQAVGLPQLLNLKSTIQQAGTALTGRPIDYNTRISLGRYFNGSSADRMTLEVWRARILGPALEQLRGMGAMSEREMEAAMNAMANPNMQLGAALQLIDEKIATAQRRVASAQATSDFFTDAGGITGVRNKAGQDYSSYLTERLGSLPGSGADGANVVPRGGYADPPPDAIAQLRSDTSAAARAEFDQIFGPGAAQRALSGARQPAANNPMRRGRGAHNQGR